MNNVDRSMICPTLNALSSPLLMVAAMASLAATPFLFRRLAGKRGSLRRELVVSFGADGYVIKHEIAGSDLVVVLGVRHQREKDFH